MSLSVSFNYAGNIKEETNSTINKQEKNGLIEVFTAPPCTFSREQPAIKTQKYD